MLVMLRLILVILGCSGGVQGQRWDQVIHLQVSGLCPQVQSQVVSQVSEVSDQVSSQASSQDKQVPSQLSN